MSDEAFVEDGTALVVSDEFPQASRFQVVTLATESARSDDASLDSALEWSLRFEHPETWTDDEARTAFVELLAKHARARCHVIIAALQDEIVPIVLPQLEQIASYETRMWRVRNEPATPEIKERWVSLPLVT